MRLFRYLTSICLLLTTLVASGKAADRTAIGDVVKDFQFTDIRFLPRTLSEFGERKAYVLVFTTLECPIVRRSLPKLRSLDEEFRDKGVQFVGINVSPGDSIVDVAYQAIKADIAFPFAKDFTGEVTTAVGASRTPECVVLGTLHFVDCMLLEIVQHFDQDAKEAAIDSTGLETTSPSGCDCK
jgi:peroxiredoxin